MTKPDLHTVRKLYKQLQNLKQKIISLRSAVNNLTRVLDGMPHNPSPNSRVEKLTLKIVETQQLAAQVENDMLIAAEILTINICDVGLNELEEKIMLQYYVDCKSNKDIMYALNIYERRFYRLRFHAEKIFFERAKILEEV